MNLTASRQRIRWLLGLVLILLTNVFVQTRVEASRANAILGSTLRNPTQDIDVQVVSSTGNNDGVLRIEASKAPADTSCISAFESYMMFDLSAVSDVVSSGTLTMTVTGASSSMTLAVRGGTDDSWTESTTTQVTLNPTDLATATSSGSGTVVFSSAALGAFLDGQKGGNATLGIVGTVCTSPSATQTFNSSEGATQPVLEVVTAETRYVGVTSASDSGDCTTIGTPCATIAYAHGQAADGDTIRVIEDLPTEAGFTCTKQVTLTGPVGGASIPTVTIPAGGLSGLALINSASCNLTVKGLALDETGAGSFLLFSVSSGTLTAYGNNFIGDHDFSAFGFVNSTGGTLNLRGNYLSDTGGNTGDLLDYRLGAAVTGFADDTSGSSASLTSGTQTVTLAQTTALGDTPVVVLHGSAPFGLAMPGGYDQCLPYFDTFVVNGTGSQDSTWRMELVYDSANANCSANNRHLYLLDQPATGGPPTDPAAWSEVVAGTLYTTSTPALTGLVYSQTATTVHLGGLPEAFLYGTGGGGGGGGANTPLAVGLLSANATGEAGLPINWIVTIAFVLLAAVSGVVYINRRQGASVNN